MPSPKVIYSIDEYAKFRRNLMSPTMIIYWIFFAILFLISIITLVNLNSASKKQNPPEKVTNVESFLLWANPNIPMLSFSKLLPGTFIGFGILGTFLGFANGISSIDMTGNSEQIFSGISNLLSGMSTAFNTSIIGVILSVIFSILFQLPIHRIKNIIRNQPTLDEEQKENINLSMQEYVNQVRELTTNLVSAKQSMESLPEKFNAVGKSLEESIAPVKETFGQMQDTLQSYAEQAKAMENASKSIGETLRNFSETNEKITQNISDIFEKSEEMNKNIIAENQALTEAHKTTLEEYKLLDENISTALEKLNSNVKAYSETMEKTLVETLENFTKAAEKVSNSLLGVEG